MRHTLVQAFKRSLRRFGTSEYGDPRRRISCRPLRCEPLEDRRLLSIAASISGYAYCDINDNGVRDAAEIGIPGALVTLTGTDAQGHFVEVSRLTAGDGSYLFEDLEPGTYAIDEAQPEVFLDGKDTLGSLGGNVSNDRFSNIVLTADAEGTGYNFGEGRLRPQFATLRMLLASRPPVAQFLSQTVADGEEQAGRTKLAELIRQGVTMVPNEVLDKAPIALNDTYTLAEDAVLQRTAQQGVLANDLDVARNPMLDSIDTSDYVVLTVDGPSHGQLVLGDDGSFTYTPDGNYSGTDSFTYVLANGILDSNEATVTLIVTPVNDPPVAAGNAYSIGEDGVLTVNAANGVLANDTDVEGSPLTAILVTGPQHGTLALNAAGSFTYTPAADYFGADSFTYKANDGSADSNTATVTITVNSVNGPPAAVADSYQLVEDSTLTVTTAQGVLHNDTDEENDPLTAILVSGPQHGTLALDAAGSFTYTPAANYFGTDSFTYKANDGLADSNTATVTVTVSGVNDAPAAAGDAYIVDEDNALVIDEVDGVLDNDTDVEGNPLTAILVTGPQHGTLALNAAGSFTYTPAADYFGADSFTYKANDGSADSNTATVTITVNGVNDAPAAAADSYEVDEDGVLTVTTAEGVLANDADVDGNPLTAILVTGPQHGTLSLDADGSFVYTPAASFHGADAFTYKANDGSADSDEATASITVIPANFAPAAADDQYRTSPGEVLAADAAAGLLANDTDNEGNPLTASVVTQPSHGTLSLDADGSFTYTPEAGFHGADSFTYRANDGLLDSNEATVTILVNYVPVAADDAYEVDEDGTLAVTAAEGVLTNDSDADADPVTAILVSGPSHATLVLNADGSFTYTPEENYFGADAFTYGVNDGFEDSNEATVTITVHPVNDAPVAANDGYGAFSDAVLTIDAAAGLLANDTDVDSDPLTASVETQPSHGTLNLNADGSFTYTPEAGFHGIDSFTYRANDGLVDSNEATVTILVNHAPVAADDAYEVDEDQALTVVVADGVLANDSDADADPLTTVLASGPSHGEVLLDDDGSFTYTPDADYVGPDAFTYAVNDGFEGSNEATVTITVHPVNDAPVAVDDAYEVDEDQTLTVVVAEGVLPNDSDEDADPLTAVLVSGPSHGTAVLGADGSFTYTPEENYFGADTFTYTANDGSEDSNEATVTITVHPVADAPVAVDDVYEVDEDGTLVVTVAEGVLANDTDGDDDPLIALLDIAPQHGVLQFESDGSFEYIPPADFNGTDTFVYAVNDGFIGFDLATVTITVNAVNDPPVAEAQDVATDEDVPLQITLAGDDGDPETDQTLSFALGDGPMHGTLSGFDPVAGTVTYTPAAGYVGQDVFTFTVNDGQLDSTEAYVIIDVTDVNDPPEAVDDAATTEEDIPVVIDVLGNDTDADPQDVLTVTSVTQGGHGVVTVNANGTIRYAPEDGFDGSDSFTYTISDGNGAADTATVSVTVTPAANVPLIDVGDHFLLPETPGQQIQIWVSGGQPVEGLDFYIQVADGGPEAVELELIDPPGILGPIITDVDLITGTIFATNNWGLMSTYINDVIPQFFDVGLLTFAGSVLANGLLATVTIDTTGFASGTWELHMENTLNGPSELPFAGARFRGGSITILQGNQPPVAEDDQATTEEDAAVIIGVLANDTDINPGDTLSVASVTQGSHGQVAINNDDTITYTPGAGFVGADQFTYTISDGQGGTDTATVAVTVTAAPDLPLIQVGNHVLLPNTPGQQIEIWVSGGQLVQGLDFLVQVADGGPEAATAGFADPPGIDGPHVTDLDLVTATIFQDNNLGQINSDAHLTYPQLFVASIIAGSGAVAADGLLGTVTIDTTGFSSGSWELVMTDTPAGKTDFQYTGVEIENGSITIQAVNHAPTGSADSYEVDEDGTLSVPAAQGVLGNDTDPNGDSLTAELVSGASHGSLVLNADGSFTYTPQAGFSGNDGFTYRAKDAALSSNNTAVTITVNAAGAAPTFQTIADVTLLGGSPLFIPLDGFDADGQALSYTVASSNPSLVAASVPQGNRSMRISVAGYGDMVLELHEHLVPEVTQPIIDLAEDGFYDGVIFHRVMNEFMIQGGNPSYTGGDTSGLVDFDDRFHVDLQHNRPGVLSMAKTDDDTNNSQFFITEVPTRWLDFNHSIFGLLVEGENVREAISNVATGVSDRPLANVVMQSVEIFLDQENGVLMLKAPEGASGQADVTVTVTDEDSLQYQQTFHVTVQPDLYNGGPFLGPIGPIQTTVNTPAVFQLSAIDVEGNAVSFDALKMGSVNYTFGVNSQTGQVTVTPPAGFTGTMEILVRVRPTTSSNTLDVYDSQVVEITVASTAQALVDAVLEAEEDWLSY